MSDDIEIEPEATEEVMKVVSEINTFLQDAKDIKPLNKSNRIARLRFSMPKSDDSKSNTSTSAGDLKKFQVDKDGDLILTRTGSNQELEEKDIFIEYENSTTLSLVGLQVWRGAFLLSDFIIHYGKEIFENKMIMELGSGVGFSSIVAALYARQVVATDLNEPTILGLIRGNIEHNRALLGSKTSTISVKSLDFTDLNWSPETFKSISETQVFIVADVIYAVHITEAFVKTLKKIILTTNEDHPVKDFYISMEKRYVFTMHELDPESAPMYAHFVELLEIHLNLTCPKTPIKKSKSDDEKSQQFEGEIESSAAGAGSSAEYKNPNPKVSVGQSKGESNIKIMDMGNAGGEIVSVLPGSSNGQKISVSIQLVPIDLIPQYFNYERAPELVLWHISAKILP